MNIDTSCAKCFLRMTPERRIRFLNPDQVTLLCRAALPGAYEQIDRALYVTAAMTGLRQGELIALRWRDVDWSAARVRVRQNYVLGQFGTPKSRRSTRSVPMADRVAGELDLLYQHSDKARPDDLVFADPHSGQPLSKPAILRRYRKALGAAGLDMTHRFHDLRHTFGTAMAAAGVPMRTLQEWLGHRDIATTQIYADYTPSAKEAAYVQAAFGTAGVARPGAISEGRPSHTAVTSYPGDASARATDTGATPPYRNDLMPAGVTGE